MLAALANDLIVDVAEPFSTLNIPHLGYTDVYQLADEHSVSVSGRAFEEYFIPAGEPHLLYLACHREAPMGEIMWRADRCNHVSDSS